MSKILSLMIPVVLLDQITKIWLLYVITGGFPLWGHYLSVVPYQYMIARWTSWWNLVFVWNPGTAFSLFKNAPSLLLIVLTGAIIGYLWHTLFYRTTDKLEKLALTLIIGGAIGNLIDRVRFGAVVDFIQWHYAGFFWPSFNIADVAISAGIAIYLLYFLREYKNGRVSK